jgi:hypothetical protein
MLLKALGSDPDKYRLAEIVRPLLYGNLGLLCEAVSGQAQQQD